MENRTHYALITVIQLFLLQVLFFMPVLLLCFLNPPFTKFLLPVPYSLQSYKLGAI